MSGFDFFAGQFAVTVGVHLSESLVFAAELVTIDDTVAVGVPFFEAFLAVFGAPGLSCGLAFFLCQLAVAVGIDLVEVLVFAAELVTVDDTIVIGVAAQGAFAAFLGTGCPHFAVDPLDADGVGADRPGLDDAGIGTLGIPVQCDGEGEAADSKSCEFVHSEFLRSG